ncbi:Protein CBG05269 [Caenorhabditis briggsae]|nr:Protein CBG05269 [Caenorhabditis briggsae]ULT84217.1 hypothetical protein L3Y34_013098 [Caenorhabditis briggsae]UMM43461.1 hypothetical protein L5515_018945 [Caenorhabditis briggsae]CAP25790.1 Protein CBG05269 [Caenorhabditis briggsae]
MGVISDVDLLGYYIQYGIRHPDHSMLLSLEREECSAKWNWWSRLENKTITAGVGNATEPCDVVQGAFVGYSLIRLNPGNFTATGVLCQCRSNQAVQKQGAIETGFFLTLFVILVEIMAR